MKCWIKNDMLPAYVQCVIVQSVHLILITEEEEEED